VGRVLLDGGGMVEKLRDERDMSSNDGGLTSVAPWLCQVQLDVVRAEGGVLISAGSKQAVWMLRWSTMCNSIQLNSMHFSLWYLAASFLFLFEASCDC